jgi:6-phosphogluconolactonase
MPRHELLQFPSADALAEAAAQKWVADLKSSIRGQPYLAALSGGRIAKKFCSAILRLAQNDPTIFSDVHFFWADERCVPPDNPESNYFVANECLFQPLKFPSGQIHRIRGEDAPEMAAREAEAALRGLAKSLANGQPILDRIFLGMGEDGHVASLFPGEKAEAVSNSATYRPVTASKPPPLRITLGYGVIAAARQVWVLASGSGKETALRQSLSLLGRTPLGKVLAERESTRVFSDISLG